MIPKRWGPALFGLILSGMMSFLVSGISTFRALGLAADFWPLWLSAWLTAWCFAFPIVMVVAPLARKMVEAVLDDH